MASQQIIRADSDRALAYLLLAPTIAVLLALTIYPLIYSVKVSFQSESGAITLSNFSRLVSDQFFLSALAHTFRLRRCRPDNRISLRTRARDVDARRDPRAQLVSRAPTCATDVATRRRRSDLASNAEFEFRRAQRHAQTIRPLILTR
jgi:ABC-type maltose transport system permease subunit